MQGSNEVLWVVIPLSVKEHSIEDHIGQEDNCSVLFASPPRSKAVETSLLFRVKSHLVSTHISNLLCILQEFIFVTFVSVFKLNPELRPGVSIHTKEDGSI